MLFNSLQFLAFFPIVCVVYFLIPSLRWRNLFLLAASYYFYMSWEPIYALLLLSSTVLTYLAALGIDHFSEKRHKRLCLTLSIVLNLLILFFYKYYGFAAESVTMVMSALGVKMHVPEFKVLLPVGISFYTFQALGYSIDVYRGDVKTERNFFTYALFVSFFPQLVAGPIERSTNLLKQFYVKHSFDSDRTFEGIKLMLWGYFLKLAMADRVGQLVDAVYNHIDNCSSSAARWGVASFCLQLYGDFAGYTFIAIGVAMIMGFRLRDNFRRPYFARTVKEFWHRWHISLSSWFMDYVYIPLGGSRCSKAKTYRNLFLTMLISGLWHGANWTFAIWGALNGLFLIIERAWNNAFPKFKEKWQANNNIVVNFIQRFWVVFLWAFACIFFRADSIEQAWDVVTLFFTNHTNSGLNGRGYLTTCAILAFFILVIKECMEEYGITMPKYQQYKVFWDNCWIVFLLLYILVFGVFNGGQFIYFQF